MTAAQIKRAILRDIKGWRGLLGLEDWEILVFFEPLPGKDHVGSSSCSWQYMEATLTFDVERMVGNHLGRRDTRRIVTHELLHVVCCGYQQFHRTEQLERLVTTMTTALDRCWRAPPPKEKP